MQFSYEVNMNNYDKMKLAEKFDEDCDFMIEESDLELAQKKATSAEAFKEKYKEFYTDIKLSHKEDW